MLIRLKYRITAPEDERWIAFWVDEGNLDPEEMSAYGIGKDPTNAVIDLLDNYDRPDLEISF